MSIHFNGRLIVTVPLCMALVLSGCSQVADKMPDANPPLVIDVADPCAPQRTAFNDNRNYFTAEILASAGAAGLMGGIAGGAIAGARGGNILVGAAIGAATGLALGAAGGYYNTLQQKNRDKASLSQAMNQDLAIEQTKMDGVAQAFNAVRVCRFNEANRLKRAVRTHKANRDTSIQQLVYLHDRFNEELALAHRLGINMQKRDTEFAAAADKMQQDGIAEKAAEDRLAAMAATKTIPEKRGSFEQAIGQAEADSQIAFDVDAAPVKA